MYIVDDPTLALITRFVGNAPNIELSDAEFLLQQIAAIQDYTAHYPAAEQQARALEWIEAHARHYRQQWQQQATVGALAHSRCPDCPLAQQDDSKPCAVHSRWLKLLRRYVTAEISSLDYIQDALNLLGLYKDRLKVSKTRRQIRCTIPFSEEAT